MTFIALLLIGLSGLFSHWLKRWARGQTVSGFVEYMNANKRHSIAAVASLFGAIAALYTSGPVEFTQQYAALAFLAGYSVDSALNKSPED